MTNVQHRRSTINDIDLQQQQHINDPPPIPLMSIIIPPTEYSYTQSTSYETSIDEPIHSSLITPITISDDNILSISPNQIDISKFHFAHVIKVPHGTNLIASNNQSTTVCINSIGNIIHLITPTGYYIRSSRWPETENKIMDLLWCEILQVYLITTSKSLYTLKYDLNQTLLIEKLLNYPDYYLSKKIFIACNSYRLYIHDQSSKFIDVYTLQFIHLHTKQLPDCIINNQIEEFSCSNSFLILYYKYISNKFIILDPITMIIKYEFDLSYKIISSIRCFDNENILIFIGMKQDKENRLVFLNLEYMNKENKIQEIIIEKTIEHDEQFIYLLPNCRDLMILNIIAARIQYLKYRS
ncbi:unnamed protein product [Rotaria sp. Silwood1]|nr:unnamed protein product [Rotaria sp. Silwood1]CAF1347349.1 unnamed protein product [Rotaria sp. Silwood1]CAF3621998.1 unnamed protein product [Rotaria sp. Silwood1]CAF4562788.1 unnamed protein product [Rotaria sp. Silwood1]